MSENDTPPAVPRPAESITEVNSLRVYATYPVVSEDSYWQFCHQSFRKVLCWAIRHHWDTLKDDLTVDHMVQDAFTRVFERREKIRKSPLAYVVNDLKDLIKKHRAREIPMGSLGLGSSDTRMGDNLPDPRARTASSIVVSAEHEELYRLGIERLRPEFRQPFELHRSGKKYSEISGIMGITVAAVQKRIETARLHILRCMVKYHPDLAKYFPGSIDPIRSHAGARAAVAMLPVACAGILTLVYVQKFPLEEVWSQAGFASIDEARLYLEEGLHILEVLYDQKMPLALIRSLNRQ